MHTSTFPYIAFYLQLVPFLIFGEILSPALVLSDVWTYYNNLFVTRFTRLLNNLQSFSVSFNYKRDRGNPLETLKDFNFTDVAEASVWLVTIDRSMDRCVQYKLLVQFYTSPLFTTHTHTQVYYTYKIYRVSRGDIPISRGLTAQTNPIFSCFTYKLKKWLN